MTITTERLTLRPLELGDAGALWPYVSDPEISRNMSWLPHQDISETRAFIEDVVRRAKDGSTIAWVMRERNHDEVVGLVSLLAIVRSHRALRYDKAELAYWVGQPFQGKGYATEACTAVLAYGYGEMGLNKVTVAHDSQNRASQALIERLGFRKVGVEERHFFKDGRWIDHVIYEKLAPDASP